MSAECWGSKEWPRIRKEYSLPSDLRFHDLRHSFATIMFAEGVQAGDVQKLMRHSSIQVTHDIYRHLLPQQLEKNLEVFNNLWNQHREHDKK